MEAEDIIPLPTGGSDGESERERERERDEACKLSNEIHEAEVVGHVSNGENLGQSMDDADIEEGQLVSETEITQDLAEVEQGELLSETGAIANVVDEKMDVSETVAEMEGNCVDVPSDNGCLTGNETLKTDGGSISGVKRTRTTYEEQQPSVHVKYYGLSRQSKQKLEELLREWSRCCAQNCVESQDQNEVSETGEEIYFPALDIGMGKTSAVSFWVENEVRKPQNEEFIHVENAFVPLYDRGFALGSISADGSSNLEGGLELLDAPRCFNCSSYSHSLKECPKPRDNVTVNNSRKQLKSRRNQSAGSRNPTRYYQDTPGGKYEGLKPGVLDAETRGLLGLRELDPPPWLNRMREIGYPPGYMEPEDENLPSGITIYADEEIKEDKEEGEEEGEILDAQLADPSRKMSVKYPGINAPIPENADERLWAARPSNSDRHRNGDGGRSNLFSESNSRGRYREQNNRDFKDDDPLGFERPSRYPPRYGDYDLNSSSRSSRENASRPRSPSSGRSQADRVRNDPSNSEDALAYRLYSSFSYSSSRRFSEYSNGSDVSRGDHPDYSSRSRDRDDRHRPRGR